MRAVYANRFIVLGDVVALKLNGRRGEWTIVDEADIDRVSRHAWNAATCGRYVYANANTGNGTERLHRFLTGARSPFRVDHINGDTLDNRRANLRVVSHAENLLNQHGARNRSGAIGVHFDARTGRWVAVAFKRWLGRFKTFKEAFSVVATAIDIAGMNDLDVRHECIEFSASVGEPHPLTTVDNTLTEQLTKSLEAAV